MSLNYSKDKPLSKISKTIFIILGFLWWINWGCHYQSAGVNYPNISAGVYPHLHNINIEQFHEHLKYLGSDELQGRGTGSWGGHKAAAYISKYFYDLNLIPIGDPDFNGMPTYYQQIPLQGTKPLDSSKLIIHTDKGDFNLDLQRDYQLFTSGDQTFLPHPLPLVFVGYGIVANEYDYNDYQDIDVNGKVVVFLQGEPTSDDSTYFKGPDQTIYASPEVKRRLAIAQGACGSILLPNPLAYPKKWEYWTREFAFEEIKLSFQVASHLSLVINPNTLNRIWLSLGRSVTDIYQAAENHTLKSYNLEMSLSFDGDFSQREFIASNVIGMLGGSSSTMSDEYIILVAHYDHLGLGPAMRGDSIYNGVFDNAAGVAAVMELARLFSDLEKQPQRSLIFLLVTGEEAGLIGSRYYIEHPVVPLYKTAAVVNIDGLSMFEKVNSFVGVGAEYSTLGNHLEFVLQNLGLKMDKIPIQFAQTESFARSDQIAFASAGIPSILISEGLDYQESDYETGLKRMIDWGTNIYHTPFDDLNQPMNFLAGEQHLQVLATYIYSLAEARSTPVWYPGVPYRTTRLQTIAEKR